MREEYIFIKNNELLLEGLLYNSSENKGVVICHPHSLMGGSMHNNVVEAMQEAFAEGKYSTLRFNFRSVGRSSGTYDEGIGEQDDILAVCKYLQGINISKIYFAGYSFGSWVGSKIIEQADNPFTAAIFISPPIDYFNFNFNMLNKKIDMIICGSNDQFCNLYSLERQIKQLNANLRIITGADHFYFGREIELSSILQEYLNKSKG